MQLTPLKQGVFSTSDFFDISRLAGITLVGAALFLSGCADKGAKGPVPADNFDLSHWKIAVPTDDDKDGKVDSVLPADMHAYQHPDFFYLNEEGGMVFAAPNLAATTPNSNNTRSELRYMSRGKNKKITTYDPGNNFALKSNDRADEYASIGGRMEATLSVDHVSLNAGQNGGRSAYAAVIGQIHAAKYKNAEGGLGANGSGYGNEPLKIVYKKWPQHSSGSIYWNYERNLAKADERRTDISYPVWGNLWDNSRDPLETGIKLGEEFSYVIDVTGDIMTLSFESARLGTVNYSINLADDVDANGNIDGKDNPQGYAQDALYFKAGVYNQCTSRQRGRPDFKGCPGSGDWQQDRLDGNYAQTTFSRLVVSETAEK